MISEFPWLTAIIAFPLIAALAIPVLPDTNGKTVRLYALGIGILELCLIIYIFATQYNFDNSSLQLVERYSWVPQLGLNWSLGVDGLSMPLVVLTGFVTTLATFAAWNITLKPRLFFSLMLVMYSAQIAVFLAQDLLMFFMLWELELVPVYLIISIWGGGQSDFMQRRSSFYIQH